MEEVPGRVTVDPFFGRPLRAELAAVEEAEKVVVVLGEEEDLAAWRGPLSPLAT